MNFFDIEKTKTRFTILSSKKEIESVLNKFNDELKLQIEEQNFAPFCLCYFYIYEGIALKFVVFISYDKIYDTGKQLMMNDIQVLPLSGAIVEISSSRTQILDKIRINFIKYLMSDVVVSILLTHHSKVIDEKYKVGIDIAKDEDQTVKTTYKSNNLERPEVINGSNTPQEPTQSISVQDKPQQTATNNFGYNKSDDDIPFTSPDNDDEETSDELISSSTDSLEDYDIDDILGNSMPEQESPHEQTIESPITETVTEESPITETVTEESNPNESSSHNTEDIKAKSTNENRFSSMIDDVDLDFSDLTMETDEDGESAPIDGF